MVRAVYISIILIWSTTPLAIHWSSQSGMWFGVTGRMIIGLASLALLFAIKRRKLPGGRKPVLCYLTAGLGIYTAMSLVYYSAQYIPSGWISVIFGLSPIITGIASVFLLNENHFTLKKTAGMWLGLSGLILLSSSGSESGSETAWGIFTMVLSTIAHTLSAVLLKRIDAPVSGLESTLGGLLIATPLFVVTFWLTGANIEAISYKTAASIIYLGIVATAMGFTMYYFILRSMNPVRASLISLVTPLCALFLGHILNQESVSFSVILGAALILAGLGLFESRSGNRVRV